MFQAVRLPEPHCPLIAGLQHRARQEPSFARSAPGFGNRGVQGGDFIVRGADGRGGRATILKPHNRQTAAAQVLSILLHGHWNAFQDAVEQTMQVSSACQVHSTGTMGQDRLRALIFG